LDISCHTELQRLTGSLAALRFCSALKGVLMSGYFGTEEQQRLQKIAEENVDFINSTPGACQIGRIMGCDDPERLGWENVERVLDRDGAFAFRLIPADKIEGIRGRLEARNFRLDMWDLFVGDRDSALPASEEIVSHGLPKGLVLLEEPVEPEGEDTLRIQNLISKSGIVPFSGSMLVGELGPSYIVAIGDPLGKPVSAAFGYFPHNRYSPWRSYGWGGLVSVDPSQRGKGLGRFVNAMMVVRVFGKLNASHVYELVSASNEPSRRMVQSCGLRHEPLLVCAMAISRERERYTR